MHGLWVADSNFTLVDAMIQGAIKCTATQLVSQAKTHLDILNILQDISILCYKIDIINPGPYGLQYSSCARPSC